MLVIPAFASAPTPEKQKPAADMDEPEPEPEGPVGLCPTMYCFKRETLPRVYEYLDQTELPTSRRTLGCFAQWLTDTAGVTLSGMRVPTHFKLVARSSGLAEYSACVGEFKRRSEVAAINGPMTPRKQVFVERTHSRVGLMGNPSDGFGGKTIALLCSNFWAEVTVRESDKIRLIPHPLNDPTEFGSLGDLCGVSRLEGYQGGCTLTSKTCRSLWLLVLFLRVLIILCILTYDRIVFSERLLVLASSAVDAGLF